MEVKEENVSLKLLCSACLCVGRKLYKLTDEALKKYYLDILDEIPLCMITEVCLNICWECKALLQKSVTFRVQVQDSYRILQTYTQEALRECLLSDISRPPRLKVHRNDTVSITQSDEAVHDCDTEVKQEVRNNIRYTQSKNDEVKNEWDCLKDDDTNHSDDGCQSDSSQYEGEIRSIMCTMAREKKTDYKSNEKKPKNKGEKKILKCVLTDVSKTRHETQNNDTVSITQSDEADDYDSDVKQDSLCDNDEVKIEWDCLKDGDSNKLDNICQSDSSVQYEVEIKKIIRSIDMEKNALKKKERSKKTAKRSKAERKPKRTKGDSNITSIWLSYEDMLKERKKEASKQSYLSSRHKCETCILGFHNNKRYLAHVAAKHSPDLGEYTCPICKTVLSSVDAFTSHYKRHMRRFECGICQKRTLDKKVMQQHYYVTHEITLKNYQCNDCGKISNSIDTHRYHKDTHKARVQCTDCDKTFRHRAGLMNHRLAVHEFHNAFPCTVCDKVFRWKTSLKRHLEKHEVKGKPKSTAYCALCEVSFSSVCSYQRHMKNSLKHVTQDQLRFICDHCNKRFADKTKLRDHIEEKHLNKSYQCHICHKPSKNRVGLDQHIRNVHKGRPNNKMCHHCGKVFPTKMQLESHIRTHTGERPFICEFCPTTFSQQSNLYKHNRQVHLNIKSKRHSMYKKRKDDKQPELPVIDNQPDVYRPAMLHYSPDRGFVM